MYTAPNYVLGEAVDGIWKQDLLKFLGTTFKLKTFIETGTCDGGTLGGIFQSFEDIHTIELSDHYYGISCNRFKDIKHIHLYKGNSAEVLEQILGKLPNVPTLFWLDAHPSGGLTANGGDPLPAEISTVMKLRPDALMVIDDQSDDKLSNVVAAGVNLSGWTKEFRTGVVFLHKGGYTIPPFTN